MAWSRAELLAATRGKVLHGGKYKIFCDVVTDSGQVKKGSIFIALKGERLDGHQFVEEAIGRGAGCVVVQRKPDFSGRTGAMIVRVRDTLRALGNLARCHREKFAPKVLAITGSNGKTTTKEMVAAILEKTFLDGQPLRGRVLKTEGNYNNLVGLPLTLLRLSGKEKVAVVELGTSQPGEIKRLARIADPDVGLITSVAAAHLSGLNTLAGVAREKSALYGGVRSGGTIIVNLDDPWIRRFAKKFRRKKVTYGTGGEVKAESCRLLGAAGMSFALRAGSARGLVRLGLCGKHNLANAVGAAAMAYGIGADLTAIRRGLATVKPFPMRMQVEKWRGIGVINDAYNANPASMRAALETLAGMPCRRQRIAVLGDMLELGRESRARHLRLGRQAARLGVDRLYVMGKRAKEIRRGALAAGMGTRRVKVAEDHRELARVIRGHAKPGDWLLVKGSRGMKMEKVLQALKEMGG